MITKKQAVAMWLMAAFFYGYQYILRVITNIIMPEIIAQFHINESIYGQFSGIYYIGYALMHLPIGIMLDRYGPKKIMPSCIILTVIGMLPLIFAGNAIILIIGRLLVGIGSSAAILGLFKIIRIGFPEEQFSRMLSIAVTIGLTGAIYGGAPVNYLCETYGYRPVICGILLTGISLASLIFIVVPNISYQHNEQSIYQDLLIIITNKKFIIFSLLAGLMVGPLEGFADVWGGEFLKNIYHLSGNKAAGLTSVIFLGMCFGAPIISFIADKAKAHLAIIIISAILMMVSFLIIMSGECPINLMAGLFTLIGVLSSYQIIAIYKASTYGREDMVAMSTTTTNMILMSFGYIFHSSIGKIISTNSVNGYNFAYKAGIAIIPIALVIAAIGYLIIAVQERGISKR